MSKEKQMQKKLVTLGVILFGILAVCGGIMLASGSIASKAAARKQAATSGLGNDNAQVGSMTQQISRSGDAEKRFTSIALLHPESDFTANTDRLKDWLREAKDLYRLSSNLKLTLALEKPSDKPELGGPNYTITVRDPVRIELGAMSDTHAYSFLKALMQQSPGLLRVTRFEITRRADLDGTVIRQMSGGLNPEQVTATLDFMLVGIDAKDSDTPAPANGSGE